ncbi:MAG TPA: YjjG family noncanonical pyrimidine nucleotidase [Bacteroidia bacterium]|nr:YjjG family noncanonical pyrimidine nucleotidase [Bacteroidia bacterium]
MAKYKHIFFDLDRTLWDMDRNASETLTEMYEKYGLRERGVPSADIFVEHYNTYNDLLWDRYRRRMIDKATLRALRFKQTLAHFGVRDAKLALNVENEFILEAPRKTNLIPGAKELLDSLNNDYQLHIITNGFPEVQAHKMLHSGLTPYFDVIVTSEECGHAKPDAKIFAHALKLAKGRKEEAIMIGDDLAVDIVGARESGWAHVFLNRTGGKHDEDVMHEVKELQEILHIIG